MKDVKICDYLWFQEGPGVRNTQYTTSGVKLINVANLVDGEVDISTSDRFISEEEAYGKYSHFMADEGDFVIASSGIKIDYFEKKMGFIKKEHLPLCMNTSCIRFKVNDSSKLDIKYFMYYLKSNSFKTQLFNQITGSAQLNFGPSHLKKMTFPIIEIDKQHEIVAKLEKTKQIIKSTKALLEKYDILIKSRFIEMFGDIQTYKKEAFKDCSLFIDYRGHTPEVTETGEIRMINAKSVGKGFFKYINEYITKEIYDVWMHRGFPKANDVLFVTEGHTFGNTCQVPSDFKIFALGQRVITIRGNEGKLNNFYLNSYMQTDDFNQDINKYKTGGTAQGIRSKDLIKVEIPIPPYEKQLQFATFVQQIDKSKFENNIMEVAA